MADEIIENGCGIVTEAEDVDGLYSAVKKLVLEPEMRKKMADASGKLAFKYRGKVLAEKFRNAIEKCQ